jgi:hypothetical protein
MFLNSITNESKREGHSLAGGPPAIPAGKIWQEEYWDRFIRDEKHFNDSVNYIHNNPVKAGLVKTPQEWAWSSISLKVSSC